MFSKLIRKFVDPANPSSFPELRRVYRKVIEIAFKPRWIQYPSTIQIDTHNYCNLWMHGKGCIHCNVKPSGGWNLPRGWMPSEMIQYIIEYWGKHGGKCIAPYINGEPLMDKRLKWICDLTQKAGMHVEIDTNGTLYDNRKLLVHSAMKQVRFTFSATNSGTYRKVMGADLYWDALKMINWFLKNRLPEQYPMLYFITNKHNQKQLIPYIKRWRTHAHLVLFPLHEVGDIQKKSAIHKTEVDFWANFTKKVTGCYPKQPARPIDVFPDGKAQVRYVNNSYPCQGSTAFSVSWNGLLLHCTDLPYKFNYGHIYDHDMLEVWHRRNRAKINHPACRFCNVKHPDHDKILRKYLT